MDNNEEDSNTPTPMETEPAVTETRDTPTTCDDNHDTNETNELSSISPQQSDSQQQPTSNVEQQSDSQQQPTSNVEQQSDSHQPTSNEEQQSDSQQQPTSNVEQQSDSQQQPTSNVEQQSDSQQQPTSNVEQQSDSHQPTSNEEQQSDSQQQPTSNVEQQSDSHQPTSNEEQQSSTNDPQPTSNKEEQQQEQQPTTDPSSNEEQQKKQQPTTQEQSGPSNRQRIEASMILSGVGDALGYKNGAYEFCRNGPAINDEIEHKGGVGNIKVNPRDWMVSDDTVMHIATAEALVSKWNGDYETLYSTLAERYKSCMRDMSGRAPGNTCMTWTHELKPNIAKGYVIPFNERGGGCGAAMRAVPIGLYFNRSEQLSQLIAVSIESGRMTHNHPTGYLGALAVALFVSYAFQHKPLIEWGAGLMNTLELAWDYIKKEGRDVDKNKHHWSYFKQRWEEYLTIRGIQDGRSIPSFPTTFNAKERDIFNKRMSFSGWGGSSGHDAPMIAYDALLGSQYNAPENTWAELCSRGMFHGGDNDSTGIIAGACWGAMKGYIGVPECNYVKLEFRDRLNKLAKQIYEKNK